MDALNKLNYILRDYGLSEKETNSLIAKFLEEEAADYIAYMERHGIDRIDLTKEKASA